MTAAGKSLLPAAAALAFCRECLGWKDADGYESVVWQHRWPVYDGDSDRLDFTDLNAVMPAVGSWCGQHDLVFNIGIDESATNRNRIYFARVGPGALGTLVADSHDPCHAL